MYSERVQSRSVQGRETGQKVMDVAERLFREQGFVTTTVRQIAEAGGVSVGTVVAVGDKSTLLVRIYERWIRDFHRQDVQDVAESSADRPVDTVIDYLQPIIDYFVEDADLSREYLAILVWGQVESDVFDALAQALITDIETILRCAKKPNASAAARAMYFAYLGVLVAASHGAIPLSAVSTEVHRAVAAVVGEGK